MQDEIRIVEGFGQKFRAMKGKPECPFEEKYVFYKGDVCEVIRWWEYGCDFRYEGDVGMLYAPLSDLSFLWEFEEKGPIVEGFGKRFHVVNEVPVRLSDEKFIFYKGEVCEVVKWWPGGCDFKYGTKFGTHYVSLIEGPSFLVEVEKEELKKEPKIKRRAISFD